MKVSKLFALYENAGMPLAAQASSDFKKIIMGHNVTLFRGLLDKQSEHSADLFGHTGGERSSFAKDAVMLQIPDDYINASELRKYWSPDDDNDKLCILIQKLGTPKSRKPKDTPPNLHAIVDEVFYEKFGTRYRSDTAFVTRSTDVAEDYGVPGLFAPDGDVKFCYSTVISDLWSEILNVSTLFWGFKTLAQPFNAKASNIMTLWLTAITATGYFNDANNRYVKAADLCPKIDGTAPNNLGVLDFYTETGKGTWAPGQLKILLELAYRDWLKTKGIDITADDPDRNDGKAIGDTLREEVDKYVEEFFAFRIASASAEAVKIVMEHAITTYKETDKLDASISLHRNEIMVACDNYWHLSFAEYNHRRNKFSSFSKSRHRNIFDDLREEGLLALVVDMKQFPTITL